MQSVLDQEHQFRLNSALKNGIAPLPPRNVIGQGQPTASPTPPPPTPPAPTTPAPLPPAAPSGPSALKVAGIAATAALGTGGIVGGLMHALNPSPTPAPSPSPPVVNAPADGDLIKWLQTHGYNRPGG